MRYIVILLLLVLTYSSKENGMSIYDLNVTTIDNEEVSLEKYKGKVLLIVNVASECGFTPQYEGLEKLYQTYKDQGFMVLGFPSNQFGEQEPASNEKIKFFCHETYNVNFDMFAKIDVNGKKVSPLYQKLKKEQGGFLWLDNIKWNFTKFLVDANGEVVQRYAPITKPETLKEDIERLLSR